MIAIRAGLRMMICDCTLRTVVVVSTWSDPAPGQRIETAQDDFALCASLELALERETQWQRGTDDGQEFPCHTETANVKSIRLQGDSQPCSV